MIVDFIKGKSKLYGLFGNPVEHSISPQIHNTLANRMGIDAVYVPLLVDNLQDAVKGAYEMGFQGLNITIPFKKDVLPFLKDIDKDAMEVGAVNTLIRTDGGFIGTNTDVHGIINTLSVYNMNIENKCVVILGAGGAAYAAAVAVARLNASKIYIVNRTNKNAENLAYQLNKYYNIDIEIIDYNSLDKKNESFGLLIQTTSVGMTTAKQPSQMPLINGDILKQCEYVFEMIYSPPVTPLLSFAKSYSAITVNGYPMLFYQAVAAFSKWHNVTVLDSDIIMKEIQIHCGI